MSANKHSKVTVLLSRDEFDRFSAYCEERGFKKSTLAARLIRDHLDEERFQSQLELPLAATDRGRQR